MLQDLELSRAVSHILQRSERQVDQAKLVESFVDVGILPQLSNANNQIFYGRRGTGKTHVLKVLQTHLQARGDAVAVYVDCRTLGSTSQFSDTTIPLPTRCLALFRDLLSPIHDALLERAVNAPTPQAYQTLDCLDRLSEAFVAPVKTYNETAVETERIQRVQATSDAHASLSATPVAQLSASSGTEDQTRVSATYEVTTRDKVVFPALHAALKECLDVAAVELFILLDEWSSLPADLQPYLAEFLKRGVLPVQRATIKIAALEHRSRFTEFVAGNPIGFEVGADVATAPDLDDYYVFDRNPDQLTTVYADMLLKHLEVDLPDGYMAQHYSISNGDRLASRMFTERATFVELARAAEGVVRDLINIFTQAYFHAQRRGRETIDRQAVVEGARQWFEQDKQTHLDDDMQLVLRRIVDDVIGTRRARSFLLPRELQRHPMIQRLFDARVLHQMQRGYADKDNPGVRYNIYTLDYGTYVDLLGTSRQPQIDLVRDESLTDSVVPFDDKRSIRRIVLPATVLDPYSEVARH
jgi:hypothetical protein